MNCYLNQNISNSHYSNEEAVVKILNTQPTNMVIMVVMADGGDTLGLAPRVIESYLCQSLGQGIDRDKRRGGGFLWQ